MNRKKIFLPIALLFSFFLLFLIFNKHKWTAFTSNGGVRGQMFVFDNYLIFGTDYSKLFIVDITNDKNTKVMDMNMETPIPQFVDKGYVYVISGDTYRKIDIKKAEVVWSFVTEGGFYIDKSEINAGRLFITSQDGKLYVLNQGDGKVVWKFEGKKIESVSSRFVNNTLYYTPDTWLFSKFIYLADRGGVFYKLNKKNGDIVWKLDLNEIITGNIFISKNQGYVFTKSGTVNSVNLNNGRIYWEQKDDVPTLCSVIYKSNLIQVTLGGGILTRNIKDGNILWQTDAPGKSVNCSSDYSSDGIFTDSEGDIFRLDMNTGKLLWKKSGYGLIPAPPLVIKKLFSNNYVFSDKIGKVISIDKNGKVIWEFDANDQLDSQILINKDDLYIGTIGGMVYKINKFSGKSPSSLPILKYKKIETSKLIGGNKVFEISIHSMSKFINPWVEGRLYGVFTHQSGREIKIDGFYYDDTDWKIRFNPPLKGQWKYKLYWSDHGVVYTNSGKIDSDTDTLRTILRVDKANPKRLTLDGKTIFNGVGLQESIYDFNRNGNTLDDWTIGGENFNATSSAGNLYTKSNKLVGLADYINSYGVSGSGFNIYRYSIGNANNPLYRDWLRPPVYSIHDGKAADNLLESMKANNIHTQVAFFHFFIPFHDTPSPSELSELRYYIRYIVARYGAYVDIWELANEFDASIGTLDVIVKELKSIDFENRLITTSTPDNTEDVGYSGLDIISPHWYETENIGDADTKIIEIIDRSKKYNKPVVLGEQGNGEFNWDSTSAVRMRVRLWTAFFHEGMIIFWSMSDYKGMPRIKPFWANIYLGDEERNYVRHLQDFTSSFPISTEPINFNLDNPEVRGYGLVSDNAVSGYFFHFAHPDSPTSFNLNIATVKGGFVQWFDPSTGAVVQESTCASTNCWITSPLFKTDIAFKIK